MSFLDEIGDVAPIEPGAGRFRADPAVPRRIPEIGRFPGGCRVRADSDGSRVPADSDGSRVPADSDGSRVPA
ncbi:hypothetical protein, partial [Streptosporangium lutulentum]|uniref:hypothetical protein n=1 Tax=Streptosporangium lutulentum TaxID=1461250 RepID=UPI00362BF5F8